MLHVQMAVRGVGSADEDRLERLVAALEGLGAIDPAVVYYPADDEVGMCFEIEEDRLGAIS